MAVEEAPELQTVVANQAMSGDMRASHIRNIAEIME